MLHARKQSKCYVCDRMIDIGQPIENEQGIGWIHAACTIGLNEPVDDPWIKKFCGPSVKTMRDWYQYARQYDAVEDPYNYPAFDLEEF